MIVASLPMAACGGSSEADQGERRAAALDDELLARLSAAIDALPAGSDVIAYVDLVEARGQLGLPEDTDVINERRESEYQLFTSVALTALPYASVPTGSRPLVDAIDGGQLESVATRLQLFGEPAVAVLRTRQPFAEISSNLRQRGYGSEAELLVSDRSAREVFYPVVGYAGDGVVVLAGSERSARAAMVGREAALTPAAELIAEVPGVARAAGRLQSACIRGWALGQDVAPPTGEYLLVIDGPVEAKRMTVSGQTLSGVQSGRTLEFGEARTESDQVRATFRSQGGAALPYLVNDGPPYQCPD